MIICVGINHRTAPVELRERLDCSLEDLARRGNERALSNGNDSPNSPLIELFLLSTCNRLELYAAYGETAASSGAEIEVVDKLLKLLADQGGVSPAQLRDCAYFYAGPDAARHLCRVAAGLDSAVLGEPQILGQVQEAYLAAQKAQTIGPRLDLLCRAAARSGKRARAETAISQNPASVSSVAIALAQETLRRQTDLPFQRQRVLVIGLGEMGQLSLKALRARGVQRVTIINRTLSRAEQMAARWDCRAAPWEELPQALAEADLVISATGARRLIIDEEMARRAIANREQRPLIFIDLAVPRNIEPAVGQLPAVHLYDVDDLRGNLDESLAARRREIPRVEAIIEEEMAALQTAYQTLAARPLISDLRQKAEKIRQRELDRTLRFLGEIDADTARHVEHFSRALVNKLLHEPTLFLKEQAQEGQVEEYETAVRDLFGLRRL